MKVLLDTNIIIHRETSHIINKSIGQLFRLLDKGKYTKCIHPVTIKEIEKNLNLLTVQSFQVKLESYKQLIQTTPIGQEFKFIIEEIDKSQNDFNDSILLNEIYMERIDYFITEDKKIHKKAKLLDIDDKVFTIETFIDKELSEHPELINYKVLSVRKKRFGELNINDVFFDTFKNDYNGYVKWFTRKADEFIYVTYEDNFIASLLYLKEEDHSEDYSNINPVFFPKKRLKIGTFKITRNGARLSERFIKIIFDNALRMKVQEIYVTIFNKDLEKKMLLNLLFDWGFKFHGYKQTASGKEEVYIRDFIPYFDYTDPKLSYPYITKNNSIFLAPIYPDYHTDLLPDSLLNNEKPEEYKEETPHRNALKKVYISRSIERNVKQGDLIIFYRTGGYHKSVITTLGVVESIVFSFKNSKNFITKCRKRSVYSDQKLLEWWNYNSNYRPFIVNFLYCYTLPKRINLKKMIDLGIIADINSAPRGFTKISKEHFETILRETHTNESIIVD